MERINISVCWNRNGRLKKDGTAAVSVAVAYKGERTYINTGVYVVKEHFDKRKERIINHPQANLFNMQIKDVRDKYERRYYDLCNKGDIFYLEDIINTENKPQKDFIEFIREQATIKTNQNGDAVGDSQQNAYKNLIDNLTSFYGHRRIPFDKVTADFIKRFDMYLQSAPIHNGSPLHHNTRCKRHDILKSFVLLALDEGLITNDPYRKFTYRRLKTRRNALTADELKRIEGLQPLPSLQLARDLFLFGCYTGLRFNDIKTATTQNLTYDGKKVFLIVREGKTQKINKIPLHLLFDGKAIAIIDKYKTENRATIFPSASDQAINRNIKAIAQSVGINKEVSFHCSRHTFGSLLAQFTHDPLLIKNLMNHSDIHTSLRYIHEAEDERERKLQNVDWNF